MSKVLDASCLAGVVSVDGVPLLGATVLSEGVAASDGFAVLDEGNAWYIAKTSPDLETTLDKLNDVLSQLTTALTNTATALSLHDAIVGPVAAANIAAITTANTAITATRIEIVLLKAGLK